MRTQPQEIIDKLEADNSRLAKEAVLQEAMEEGQCCFATAQGDGGRLNPL